MREDCSKIIQVVHLFFRLAGFGMLVFIWVVNSLQLDQTGHIDEL